MPYCSLEDLLAQVPESVLVSLTDDEGTGQVNQGRIAQAIEDAQSEIDAYAQARYQVPFSPVPGVIWKIAVDITLYNLFSRRGFDEESADSVIVTRYKSAQKFLENLSRGVVTIGVSEPPPDAETRFDYSERMFTRKRLEVF